MKTEPSASEAIPLGWVGLITIYKRVGSVL